MSVAISRSEATPSPVLGTAEISFAPQGGATRLAHLFQQAPLRVLFPNPEDGEPASAALVNTAGGLVGGDRLGVRVEAHAGASCRLYAQSAEKVYRSLGPDCRIEINLVAGRGAWLECLPQETIVFDGARLRRRTRIDAEPGARVLAGEILVFGRTAMGERTASGLVHEAWEVRTGGRLAWADALHLDGDLAHTLAHPAGFDGATAAAAAVYVADDAASHLETARRLVDAQRGVRAGATVVNGVLLVRWLSRDGFCLRAAFGEFWRRFRAETANLPPRLPRLWHI